MSIEIIENIRAIEREKGIEQDALVRALEDALLAAYKKTPGAARHAVVVLDDEGEFRVFGIEIPKDLETRLLDEAREAKIEELERIEEETGEKQHTLVADDELELDWDQVPEQQIARTDVTPQDFGRIAAMTAKQVIQQRIREAERSAQMEYFERQVGEIVSGIVQASNPQSTTLGLDMKAEGVMPANQRIPGEKFRVHDRLRAIILEVKDGSRGPQIVCSWPSTSSHARSK